MTFIFYTTDVEPVTRVSNLTYHNVLGDMTAFTLAFISAWQLFLKACPILFNFWRLHKKGVCSWVASGPSGNHTREPCSCVASKKITQEQLLRGFWSRGSCFRKEGRLRAVVDLSQEKSCSWSAPGETEALGAIVPLSDSAQRPLQPWCRPWGEAQTSPSGPASAQPPNLAIYAREGGIIFLLFGAWNNKNGKLQYP